jgi:hypothetical protein
MIAPEYGSNEQQWMDASLAITLFIFARKG